MRYIGGLLVGLALGMLLDPKQDHRGINRGMMVTLLEVP